MAIAMFHDNTANEPCGLYHPVFPQTVISCADYSTPPLAHALGESPIPRQDSTLHAIPGCDITLGIPQLILYIYGLLNRKLQHMVGKLRQIVYCKANCTLQPGVVQAEVKQPAKEYFFKRKLLRQRLAFFITAIPRKKKISSEKSLRIISLSPAGHTRRQDHPAK